MALLYGAGQLLSIMDLIVKCHPDANQNIRRCCVCPTCCLTTSLCNSTDSLSTLDHFVASGTPAFEKPPAAGGRIHPMAVTAVVWRLILLPVYLCRPGVWRLAAAIFGDGQTSGCFNVLVVRLSMPRPSTNGKPAASLSQSTS